MLFVIYWLWMWLNTMRSLNIPLSCRTDYYFQINHSFSGDCSNFLVKFHILGYMSKHKAGDFPVLLNNLKLWVLLLLCIFICYKKLLNISAHLPKTVYWTDWLTGPQIGHQCHLYDTPDVFYFRVRRLHAKYHNLLCSLLFTYYNTRAIFVFIIVLYFTLLLNLNVL